MDRKPTTSTTSGNIWKGKAKAVNQNNFELLSWIKSRIGRKVFKAHQEKFQSLNNKTKVHHQQQ
jgi:hypothetical protein